MKSFMLALQFLTVIPIHIKAKIVDADLGRSVRWFPVVGALLGLLLFLANMLLMAIFPLFTADLLTLVFLILFTGGLHLDGLADLFDGIGSHKTKEGALTVMRDSRIGTMGVLALLAVLMLKYTALLQVQLDHKEWILFMMPVLGRWVQVFLLCFGDYARQEGAALPFFRTVSRNDFWTISILPALLLVVGVGLPGILVIFATALAAAGYLFWLKRRLGGQTGDTLGAASEMAEVLFLLIMVSLQKMGGRMGRLVVILGTTKSGKSTLARDMALPKKKVAYLATLFGPHDEEMKDKIKRHRRSRPGQWKTIDNAKKFDEAVRGRFKGFEAVILDGVAIWLTSLLPRQPYNIEEKKVSQKMERLFLAKVQAFLRAVKKTPAQVIVVADELGEALCQKNALARWFRDINGVINQQFVRQADEAYLTVAGQKLKIK